MQLTDVLSLNPNSPRGYDLFGRLPGVRDVQWQLVAQAGIRPGSTVLEIGTGTGAVLLMAKAAVPDVTAIGLDPDGDRLAFAGEKARDAGLEVRWDEGSADRLPYADGSVDTVLSSFMLHHLDPGQQGAALAEIRRVLAPGGSLHLLDMTSGGMAPWARVLRSAMALVPGGGGHAHHAAAGHGHGGPAGHGHGAPTEHGHEGPAGHGDDAPTGRGGVHRRGEAEVLALLGGAGLRAATALGRRTAVMGGCTYFRAYR